MTGWLSRFFNRSSGGEIEGYVAVMDESGRAVYRPDRRSKARQPFSGRPELHSSDFNRLSDFTAEILGIHLSASDNKLLEGRLMNRLRTLHIGTFKEYTGYLLSKRGINGELEFYIDAITTGKTHFWRESGHFEFILHTGADELLRTRDSIRAWSVGCSTGEEPYTLAMTLSEHASKYNAYDFRVIGSDISELAILKASAAEYELNSVVNLPAHFRDTYMVNKNNNYFVNEQLKEKVSLKRMNLLDDEYNLQDDQDLVFFRNVGIYFSPETRKEILQRICRLLSPGGYLFLGHSEGVEGLDLPLTQVQGTIYRK